MKLLSILITVVFTLFASHNVNAEYLVNETPDSRYIMSDDGTVTDKDTGLMWLRCSIGQVWNKDTSTCTEVATSHTWQQAFESINLYQDENTKYTNWRLPNINELRTLAAYDKHAPAINLVAFPNTLQSTSFWSSTPDVSENNKSWVMTMESGDDYLAKRTFTYEVKLVRNLH